MKTSVRSGVLAAAVTAGVVLVGCAPAAPEVGGIGSGGGSGSVVPPGYSPNPTPTVWVEDDTRPGGPGDLPDVTVDTGTGQDLPVPVSAGNRADLVFEAVGGFSAEDAASAFDFTSAFAVARYSSGLWLPEDMRAQAPVVYYRYSEFLTEDAAAALGEALLTEESRVENQATLDSLVPQPFDIGQATWLQPAVSEWVFGQPTYAAEEDVLAIAFEMAGFAMYRDVDGTYYAAVLRDVVEYTLLRDKDSWRINSWESQVSVETPEALEYAPPGRTVPEQVEILPVPVDEVPGFEDSGAPTSGSATE